MSRFVVDASVAVKWFLPEVHADAALQLLEGAHSLSAPDLLFPEVGNALWKRVRRGEATIQEAAATLETLVSLPLELHASASLIGLALDIAWRVRRSVYDSCYVALAVRQGSQLVTADRRLYEALEAGPLAPYLLWVAELASGAGA